MSRDPILILIIYVIKRGSRLYSFQIKLLIGFTTNPCEVINVLRYYEYRLYIYIYIILNDVIYSLYKKQTISITVTVTWKKTCLTFGPCLNIKTVFPRYGDSMLKIRRSRDRLIFNMGIPILVRRHLYIETAPWSPLCAVVCWGQSLDKSVSQCTRQALEKLPPI